MASVTVSAATPDDMDALLASVAGLFREDAGQHDSLVNADWPASEGAAYYSRLLTDRDCLLALARDDDRVVGHLVAPDSRRAGAGSLLVRHFFSWARERGAQQASVTAYAANDAALRFYARHGFTPKSVTSRAVL